MRWITNDGDCVPLSLDRRIASMRFWQWTYRLLQSKWSNKYVWAVVFFVVWITFFDAYNLQFQYRLHREIEETEARIEEYRQKIRALRVEELELKVDKEKYARERYFLHDSNEDVFIIK